MTTIAQWLRSKTDTRWRFVLVYGVLGWGLLCPLLLTLWTFFHSPEDLTLARLAPAWIAFPIGGIFFGLAMHWWNGFVLRRIRRR